MKGGLGFMVEGGETKERVIKESNFPEVLEDKNVLKTNEVKAAELELLKVSEVKSSEDLEIKVPKVFEVKNPGTSNVKVETKVKTDQEAYQVNTGEDTEVPEFLDAQEKIDKAEAQILEDIKVTEDKEIMMSENKEEKCLSIEKKVITSRDILVGLLSMHTGNIYFVETKTNVMRMPYYMDAPKAKEFGVIDRAPEKVVFHLVTNEINYSAMKSWFAMNMDNLRGVTVEVQQFEDFKCLNASYVRVLKQLQYFDTQSYYFSRHNDDGRTPIKFRNSKSLKEISSELTIRGRYEEETIDRCTSSDVDRYRREASTIEDYDRSMYILYHRSMSRRRSTTWFQPTLNPRLHQITRLPRTSF
ncbi:hypothetical protein F2Q68_00043920 [Brassica cretica]|uniref:Uncharacterized protein n=1 Tax=Brassica cretica TaxID=69181 RepID=A0A8S9LFV0_BRACR|nr:hypothetical protein F2Q68_00043920 [Brassica cretica]